MEGKAYTAFAKTGFGETGFRRNGKTPYRQLMVT